MSKPVIGIIGNHSLLEGHYPAITSGEMNTDAVAQVCQAIPVIIAPNPQIASPEDLMAVCDGFVFTGGRPNVHPRHYGEELTDAYGDMDERRDALTLPLIRALTQWGQPYLAICRGFQEMNVALGGSLHPEIRDLPGRDNHRMPPDGTLEERFALRHDVTVSDAGPFAKIFGQNVVRTNTLHGQGIKTAGPNVVIDGTAPDGTAEAIYVKDAKGFAMGVQWHPEYNAANDPVSRPLFKALGDAARVWRAHKQS
ncbi:MAG: gamma-glutamyl-gamma-aminobutyrate hydrolase family protein [Planktomarina sp.]